MRFAVTTGNCRVPRISLLSCGLAGCLLVSLLLCAQQPQAFTLQQVLSAPYASELTAAPVGNLFAWVENAEGRHNLWVGSLDSDSKPSPARQLTHNSADDGLEITNIAWSPDAKTIAFAYGTPNGADGKPANPAHLQHIITRQIVLQPIAADSQPIVIGEGRAPLFTRDGNSILFLRNGQIWITRLQDSAPHQLVVDRGTASALTLSPDGNTLAFISHRHQPDHNDLALFNLKTNTLTFPSPSTGNDSAPAFSPDGQHLAWLRAPFTQTPEYTPQRTSPNPWSIQLLDLTQTPPPTTTAGHLDRPTGVESPLYSVSRTIYSPEPNQPGSALPHLATGEPYLLWASESKIIFYSEADGWVHLYAVSLSGKTSGSFTRGPEEIEDLSLDANDGRLLFSSNDDGIDALDWDRRHILSYLLPDGSTETLGRERETSGRGIEMHPIASVEGTIAVLASDVHTPMHPAIVAPNGTIVSLSHTVQSNAPFVTPEQVLFPSTDSLTLHGQLFLPMQHADSSAVLRNDRQEKHPAILFLHGGPNRQMLLGYPAMEYYSNAYAFNQYLASRGFIVLSVNYRMGIGYGMDFREAANVGPNGAAEYNDVLAAAKYLQSRPDVDPKRIGLWGGSYGGYLTELALARNSDLFAAGVSVSGIFDWNLEANASDWKQGSNAEQDALAAKARASSPISSIDKWRSPVLLIHGDNDPDVAFAQTLTAADALRARHVPVEELIFPDEVHDFLLHSTWLSTYTAAAAFFERKLKP